MKTAYFEMIGGASGNMILGALVDAGADLQQVEAALRTIPVSGWHIERSRIVKRGIAATYIDVVIPGEDERAHQPAPEHDHGHEHEHEHEHEHGHEHEHDRPHEHDVPLRKLEDILAIVAASGLTASQKARASAIYTRLGEAEARVHGTSVADIHFHEVGQVDAIVDVAAACVALDLLGVERVTCSAYPLGTGSISMHHGRYPNPPPATAELMRGAPTIATGVKGEMVTTTAAAIFSTLVAQAGARPSLSFDAIGYGAGRSDFSVPNVLRVTLGEEVAPPLTRRDEVTILEANIDDMSPQHFELAFERVFAAGALDAWLSPVTMKKMRPAITFSVIAGPQDAERCAAAMLRDTTTLGVRYRNEKRFVLDRTITERETPFGRVRIKEYEVAGCKRMTLEYDDLLAIARAKQRPIADVARDVERYITEHDRP